MKPRTDKDDPKHEPRNARVLLDKTGRRLASLEHGRVSLYAQNRSLSKPEALYLARWLLEAFQ